MFKRILAAAAVAAVAASAVPAIAAETVTETAPAETASTETKTPMEETEIRQTERAETETADATETDEETEAETEAPETEAGSEEPDETGTEQDPAKTEKETKEETESTARAEARPCSGYRIMDGGLEILGEVVLDHDGEKLPGACATVVSDGSHVLTAVMAASLLPENATASDGSSIAVVGWKADGADDGLDLGSGLTSLMFRAEVEEGSYVVPSLTFTLYAGDADAEADGADADGWEIRMAEDGRWTLSREEEK